jgi:hypothetical protein
VGNTTSSNAGSIRFNGTHFQGYDGTDWKYLDSTTGGSASKWTASGTSIYNNNTGSIGIGLGVEETPVGKVDARTSSEVVTIRSENSMNNGIGIAGHANTGATAIGTFGTSSNGKGIYGETGNGYAGYFIAHAGTGKGVVVAGGKSGFGTTSPSEMVDVNGAVRVGNTTSSNAGSIRFDGTHFQGYDGTDWKYLDSTTGGSASQMDNFRN